MASSLTFVSACARSDALDSSRGLTTADSCWAVLQALSTIDVKVKAATVHSVPLVEALLSDLIIFDVSFVTCIMLVCPLSLVLKDKTYEVGKRG